MKIKKLKNLPKLVLFGIGCSVNDRNGRPYGIKWLTICTSWGNFRVLPMGWIK